METYAKERIWYFVDKSDWGEGVFQDEPDKISWTDTETGLPCLIVRGPLGALCGYVGVSEEHPWFGKDYSASLSGEEWGCDTPDSILEVHGGITFSDYCQEYEEHGICHIPEPGQSDCVWWFGWDAAHSYDFCPKLPELSAFSEAVYRDIDFVRDQTTKLAQQLSKVV